METEEEIFLSSATWYIRSESDKRWRFFYKGKQLRVKQLSSLAVLEIKERMKTLGEPPKDIEIGCLGFWIVKGIRQVFELTIINVNIETLLTQISS